MFPTHTRSIHVYFMEISRKHGARWCHGAKYLPQEEKNTPLVLSIFFLPTYPERSRVVNLSIIFLQYNKASPVSENLVENQKVRRYKCFITSALDIK